MTTRAPELLNPPPATDDAAPSDGIGSLRADWPNALRLLGIAGVVRVAYLIWASPWHLLGDEAYYWIQSQHPALSYAEKGPLLAWILAAFTSVLGHAAWVIRLPMTLAWLLAGWGVGRLTLAVTRGDERRAFFAIAIFLLTPAFLANGQICTQDGLEIAVIVGLTAVGLRLVRRWESDRSTWTEWLALYALLGLGILLKQSIPLFLSAFVVYAVMRARRLRWGPTLVAQQVVGVALLALIASPLIIWDSRNGWPLVRHTLGHLGAGGDQTGHKAHGNLFIWLGNTLAGLAGAIGPVLGIMTWASIRAWRGRVIDDERWRDQLWLLCATWPSVLFFVALSFIKPVVPSWPLPLVVPLVPIAASLTATELARSRAAIDGRRSGFQQLWAWTIGYGIGAWLLLSFPTVLGHIPVAGTKLQKTVLAQLEGTSTDPLAIRRALALHPDVSLVVAQHYQIASLLSYQLRHEATVTCASSYVSDRLTNFDMWPDTRLDSPQRLGRSMLLVGGELDRWQQGLAFAQIEPLGDGLFLARGYAGPRVARVDRRQP